MHILNWLRFLNLEALSIYREFLFKLSYMNLILEIYVPLLPKRTSRFSLWVGNYIIRSSNWELYKSNIILIGSVLIKICVDIWTQEPPSHSHECLQNIEVTSSSYKVTLLKVSIWNETFRNWTWINKVIHNNKFWHKCWQHDVFFLKAGFILGDYLEDHNTIGFSGHEGSSWSCGRYLSLAAHRHTNPATPRQFISDRRYGGEEVTHSHFGRKITFYSSRLRLIPLQIPPEVWKIKAS